MINHSFHDSLKLLEQIFPPIQTLCSIFISDLKFSKKSKHFDKNSRMPKVKVASIQCSSELCKTKENTEKLTKLIKEAAKNGAKIIVTPEACITGYVSQDMKTNWRIKGRPIEKQFSKEEDLSLYAETVPGPSTDYFCQLSKELQVYITIPILEVESKTEQEKREKENQGIERESYFKNDGPKYYNTLCLSSPKGELVSHYRKIFPWWYPEKSYASAGTRIETYDTEYGKLGLAICFDIHNILPLYKDQNLWTLLYPIAWVDVDPELWFSEKLPEHFEKNDVKYHVIGANWVVDEKEGGYDFKGFGYSTIYENGKVLNQSKEVYKSDIVYGELPYQ